MRRRKKGLTLAEVKANTIETVKDIIALGFDPDLTYVFSNFNLIQQLYPAVCEIQRHLTCNQVSHCFGVSGSDSVGRMAFPASTRCRAQGDRLFVCDSRGCCVRQFKWRRASVGCSLRYSR